MSYTAAYYDNATTYPYFVAVRSANITTGTTGAVTTLAWDLVPVSNGTFVSNIFTAPINGVYNFSLTLSASQATYAAASNDPMSFGFYRTASAVITYFAAGDNWRYLTANPAFTVSASTGATILLNAGDTVRAYYAGITSAGGMTIYGATVVSTTTYYHSSFCGYLVNATY